MSLQRRSALAAVALGLVSARAWAGAYEDFFVAILRDDGDAITALLRRGFDPNTRDPKGQVGLTIALQNGANKAFAALLASRTVNVDARNAQDESPLMIAAIKGNVEAVKALIAREADVNKTGWTPLHYAASAGSPQHAVIISLLLENHAYIDAASPNGTTPLMMAASYGSPEAVKLLVEEGADIAMRNQKQMTAMDFARRAERRDAVELLTQAERYKAQSRPPAERGRW